MQCTSETTSRAFLLVRFTLLVDLLVVFNVSTSKFFKLASPEDNSILEI